MSGKIHLAKDPVMKGLIAKHQLKEYWGGSGNYFLDLVEIVVGQQLSIKAAATIFKRLLGLFETHPKPKQLLEVPLPALRSVGLSASKANYVHNLARAALSGTLPLDHIEKLSDVEVKRELLKIKGIGPWSAEMFLLFSLKRPDVFSVGDLGLRTAIERLYGINRGALKQIEKLAETWCPHRSLACRYLWASLEAV